MFYRNYMLNYLGIGNIVTIAVMTEDMTNFKNETKEDGFYILNHTKSFIDVPREQYENCRFYLDNNGLFLGIFPPEIIEKSIIERFNQQKENRKKFQIKLENFSKEFDILIQDKLTEDYFKKCKEEDKDNLKSILYFLENINMKRKYKGLKPFDIEKEYKDYLIKYWGDWKID